MIAAYLGFAGSLIGSTVALVIAVTGWRKSDRRAQTDAEMAERRAQADAEAAERRAQADRLAELLGMTLAGASSDAEIGRMKAILLTLPGHLATFLRLKLDLTYTMKDVPLDVASADRLRSTEKPEAGYKWHIFDRSSVLKNRGLDRRNPYPEWVEAELAYDIAGLRGGDRDAVLAALSKDVRDPNDAAASMLQDAKNQQESLPDTGDDDRRQITS